MAIGGSRDETGMPSFFSSFFGQKNADARRAKREQEKEADEKADEEADEKPTQPGLGETQGTPGLGDQTPGLTLDETITEFEKAHEAAGRGARIGPWKVSSADAAAKAQATVGRAVGKLVEERETASASAADAEAEAARVRDYVFFLIVG